MSKELLINDAGFETRVALLEDGVLTELYIERPGETDIVGNIYKGRVLRVLPGMQAAFVDIGLPQAAFLYVDDLVQDFAFGEMNGALFEERRRLVDEEDAPAGTEPEPTAEDLSESADEAPAGDEVEQSPKHRPRPPIEDILREGQEILVQVAKSPIGNKGARVTSRVSIAGRFLVLMPSTTHIGVSRRIEDAEERTRLKDGLEAIRTEPFGYIVRTVCQGVEVEKLRQEVDFLTRLFHRVLDRFRQRSAPSLLYQELSAGLKAVRDLFTQEVDRLVVDSEKGYREIMDFVEPFLPTLHGKLHFFDSPEPIFDAYSLEDEISRLSRKKVWLKSGGYIVIEDTEALVSIDVNTGRFVGKQDLSETILKTNLEAVKEIAYQLRLRDIGGIIVIDFIDMEKPEDREKVHQALTLALKKDRSTTNVLPMSELGLIQMTRKRTKENVKRMLSEPCPYCEGEGSVLSKKTVCHNIYRDILRLAPEIGGKTLSLSVHPDVARFLLEEENTRLLAIEERTGTHVHIHADTRLHAERYDLVELAGE
ncbi:MAG: Rne/Rng family ribonuclease [Thermodesulfobacteriota bacterium]